MSSTGKIKFYANHKGDQAYGFIVDANGGKDIFFHNSAIRDGAKLTSGDLVTFDLVEDKFGRPRANNVEISDA
jgi:cold shock protein